MPAGDLSRRRCRKEIAAVNKFIKEGFPPYATPGDNTSITAVRKAAELLGENRRSFFGRIGSPKAMGTWKRLYGLEPDWTWEAPEKIKLREEAEKRKAVLQPYAIAHEAPPMGTSTPNQWELVSSKDNTFKFAALGDLHAGSKYCRMDVREDLTRRAERFGAQCIFDTGNWIDGEAPFNRYDIEAHGIDAQCRLLAKNYPKTEIPTYAVSGADHEGWYVKKEGIDVGRYCESVMREYGHKWTNLGYMEADIRLVNANSGKTCTLRVMHPGGGSSYALSYRPQKILESMEGGEKPGILLLGHYHKLDFGLVRNVFYIQTGCFDARAFVKTEHGAKRISSLRIGDTVWTHKNRLRPITSVSVKEYEGNAFEITSGPTGAAKRGRIAATGEHPFLTLRGWVPACRLTTDDWVAIESRLAADGSLIPHYRDKSNKEFFKNQPNKLPIASAHNAALDEYLASLPPHLKIIPLHRVTPDAITIDWEQRKIVSIEMERGRHSPSNPLKYALVPNLYNDVLWVCTAREGKRKRYGYQEKDGNIFVPVRRIRQLPWKRKVYNISVAEDQSYICGRFIVHNCAQDQTPFMRQKAIEAHVGGFLVECEQDPETGAIVEFTPHARRYFNRAYYFAEGKGNNRWSGHGPVTPVPRRGNQA